MTKILGLIPARAGSRGVPGKHYKLLNGRPLITYTIESALRSQLLHNITLSSDCHETIRIASDFPEIDIPFERPDYLSQEDTPSIAVIRHTVEFYARQGTEFDYVCLLQPTTPFRAELLIDNSINCILSEGAQSLVTVKTTPHTYNPYWGFEINDEKRLRPVISDHPLITRRQDLPVTYHRDGQIYILSTSMVMQGKLIDEDTIGLVNDKSPDINIDIPYDWQKAENWLQYGRSRT